MYAERSKWLMVVNSGRPIRTRLICFPHAGADPEQFRDWSDGLADHIELVTLRLPGHGSRLKEAPYDQWAPLLHDTFLALQPYLTEPHAFYGHSFGGRVAYEMARLAQAHYPGMTRRLFISGCRSPDSRQPLPYLHTLPKDDFIRALIALGVAPESMLHDKKLMRLFEPVMRSDLKLSELWSHCPDEGLDIPLTALYGSDDPIDTAPSMMNWREFTRREFELIEVRGNHHFLTSQRNRLLHIINTHLGVLDV
ncbi:alpha/beta fold hydrolase [Pseudomonas sp. GD03842]|uniref:thioesterase II family protein n=1 Tax=unclassified Pseudomonas TaxID=196821 RepID=UPI000D3BCA5A|nr:MULTISPECIES: alpha/beta fold hydrolase [unclassified Pseudomonas]MDH0749399.1 alpha/beta fold hydrolase [Pseudomonas sp. GD03842]RAU46250.1 thioesterase [Pseudomonas sp. RIT 409]RAU53956.1 thioesterase [Pseudomonas sp. RIT 412]